MPVAGAGAPPGAPATKAESAVMIRECPRAGPAKAARPLVSGGPGGLGLPVADSDGHWHRHLSRPLPQCGPRASSQPGCACQCGIADYTRARPLTRRELPRRALWGGSDSGGPSRTECRALTASDWHTGSALVESLSFFKRGPSACMRISRWTQGAESPQAPLVGNAPQCE